MKKLGLISISLLLATSALAINLTQGAIQPLPERVSPTPKSELGKKLFSDPSLSGNQKISCQSCHQPERGFSGPKTDGLNAPTLLNVVYNNIFFWNGRTKDLKEALREHLQSPMYMRQSQANLEVGLGQNPEWDTAFNRVFKSGVTIDNVIEALESYLNTLTTPDSRFDQYLKGTIDAITDAEKEGFELFKQYGCISCHQGKNVGGNIHQKLGIYQRFFKDPTPKDYGLYQTTGINKDVFVFRVAPLRNVALTGPYFHDGSKHTLNAAIEAMGTYQLNRNFLSSDIEKIAAFLKTLSGDQELD